MKNIFKNLLKLFFVTILIVTPKHSTARAKTSPKDYVAKNKNVRGEEKFLISRFNRYLKNPNIQAFLDSIAAAEGTEYREIFFDKPDIIGSAHGYNVRFPNTTFYSYKKHPEIAMSGRVGSTMFSSTASGRYQILKGTWNTIARRLDLKDFSPRNQDIAALYLFWEKKVIKNIASDNINTRENFEQVVKKLGNTWASFPGSHHGQTRIKMNEYKTFFDSRIAYHRVKGVN